MVDPFRPEPLSKPGPPRLDNIVAVCSGGWVIFVALHLMKGRLFHAGIDTAMVTLSGVLWFIARQDDGRRRALIGNLNLAVSLTGLVLVAFFSGQSAAMACWYLAVIPLIAVFQFGTNGAIGWTFIGLVLLGLLHMSSVWFPITPEYIAAGTEIWFGQVFMLGALSLFALSSSRGNARYIEALNKHEQALREKADALAAHANELQAARDEALTALRVKGDFLANMSHEVRTPLNGVLGMTRVLLNTNLSADQRRMVSSIDTSGQALMTVINDVLDFSKIEAGEMKFESAPFSVRECAEDVLELFSREAEEKNIDLAFRQHPTMPPRVLGDAYRVRQVLLNLVNNAVKFTPASPDGRASVIVEAARKGENIEIRVRDTGIGISPADQARLFESFVQVDTSMARRFGGTGLGLTISRGLVQAMRGSITVQSEVGRGSTFIVDLPLPEAPVILHTTELEDATAILDRSVLILGPNRPSRAALVEMTQSWAMNVDATDDHAIALDILDLETPDLVIAWDDPQSQAILDQVQTLRPKVPILLCASFAGSSHPTKPYAGVIFRPIRLRQALSSVLSALHTQASTPVLPVSEQLPLKVLIVEDNAVNQQVVMTMMQRLGYEPQVASNGREAVTQAEMQAFDFIFMDMHMPDMDGLEATRQIRAGKNGEVPWIAALTASVADEQRKACMDAGMNDFVSKPFRFDTLVAAIERAGKTRGWLEAPAPVEDHSAIDDLRAMYEGNTSAFHDLVRRHIETSSELLATLTNDLETENWDGIVLRAHSLKSSSAMFSEHGVSTQAAKLEQLGKNMSKDQASKTLEALKLAWNQYRSEWERELDRTNEP